MSLPGGRRAQEHSEHTAHQEKLLNALLKVFLRVGRDLGCTWGGERGILEEGVDMAHVVLLLGREVSASAAWGGISTPPPPQPFHPWQIPLLFNPTKTGSSFHSSQWCLCWLGAVPLCLHRQKARSSPKNNMAGKGKTVSLSLCCLSSPALPKPGLGSCCPPQAAKRLRFRLGVSIPSRAGIWGAAAAHAAPAGAVLGV